MYSICKKTYNDGADGSHLCPDYADLLADRYITVVLASLSAACCVQARCAHYLCGCVVAEDVLIFDPSDLG